MSPHVLVAEDSRTQAHAVRLQLEEAGYRVTVCPDGERALEELRRAPADVVVSDVVMPLVDGYELCRRVKADPALAATPVLLMTSLIEPIEVVHALEAGADGFLTKPVSPRQLTTRVQGLLEARELDDEGDGTTLEMVFMGHRVAVTADRKQIVGVLTSSFEELLRSNHELRLRENELADAQGELEAHLREAEQARSRLDQSLELSGVGAWEFDLTTETVLWWEHVEQLYGLGRGELGLDLADILERVLPEDRAALGELLEELRRGPSGVLRDHEYRVVHPDGQVRWLKIRFTCTEERRLVGVALDVTPQREAEDRLRRNEETLRGLVTASPDAIVLLGADGAFQFASEAIRELTGVSPEEFVGIPAEELVRRYVAGRAGEDPLEQLEDLLAGRRSRVGLSVDLRHRDGRIVPTQQHLQVLVDADGAVEGVVSVIRDVSSTVALQEELARATEEAEAANRAKSEFLSRMSHELRTPLNAILGFAQLLEFGDGLHGDDLEGVGHILASGRHLLQLIDEVLDISRIETGEVDLRLEPVALSAAVEESLDLLRPMASEQRIALRHTLPGEELCVVADHQRLKQVLINLCSNGVKYNRPDGEVEVRCRADGAWARVEVRDTGVGIREQDLARLFVPFDRLDADACIEGTGLGLSLSKHLVELMGGRLEVESVVEVGSTFVVSLPLAEAPVGAPEPGDAEEEVGAPAGAGTVVYVEDNEANVRLMRRILAHRPGVELLSAPDAETGCDLVRDRRPDLVLLDLQLPGRDGREVLAELRADERTAAVPVVVLSGDASAARRAELLSSGATAYLTKPYDVRMLLDVIDHHLEDAP